MKTDEELSERLRRASLRVRLPEDPVERLYRRRVTKHRRERLTAALVAMVVLVGAVGGTLFALRGVWDGHRGIPGSGKWTPERSLEVGPGQYFYLKGTTYSVADGSTNTQETWWAPDASGELRFDTNRPEKYVPYPPAGVYDKGEFPSPYQADLTSLSTDPAVLAEQLQERTPKGDSVFRTILNLLDFERSPEALPELRGALFDVAAGLDGVSRQDGVLDPVGRDSVSLRADETYKGIDNSGESTVQTMHWELFFDPGTHQLMAEAVGFEGSPVPFEILESAIVDARGAEPTGDQLLFPKPAHPFVP